MAGRRRAEGAAAEGLLERFSAHATAWAGSSPAFGLAVAVVVVWLVSGPLFAFSDTWQLVINTGTTVVTFLMVFLIQRSQNKESQIVQLKLSELVAAAPPLRRARAPRGRGRAAGDVALDRRG